MPEHEISNSAKVFLVFISFHYFFFFLQKLKGSAGSAVPEVPRSSNSQFSNTQPWRAAWHIATAKPKTKC